MNYQNAVTVGGLLRLLAEENKHETARTCFDRKIFLSSDEEGNSYHGLSEIDIKDGHIILYPSSSDDYELESEW